MGRNGFTLIELLISITIVGVILVIVLGAFQIGIRAWEKGEADIEIRQRQQVVLRLVKQQLASMRRTQISGPDEKPFFFKADERFVEFVSDLSIVPGNRYGEVYVRYRIRQDTGDGGMSLEIYEKSLAAAAGDGGSFFDPPDEAYHMLIHDMAGIEFRFLVKEQNDDLYSWQPVWDPESMEADLPAAVRLALQWKKDEPPLAAVGRVAAESLDN